MSSGSAANAVLLPAGSFMDLACLFTSTTLPHFPNVLVKHLSASVYLPHLLGDCSSATATHFNG